MAIGMIETKGLIAAIEAVDAMVKSANVEIVGNKYYKVRSGIIAVMVRGDVGAVQSAVESGVECASRVGIVLTHRVIARPDDSVFKMLIPSESNEKKEEVIEKKEELKIEVQKPIKEDPKIEEKIKEEPIRVKEEIKQEEVRLIKIEQDNSVQIQEKSKEVVKDDEDKKKNDKSKKSKK